MSEIPRRALRLRDLRQARGLTQEELADRCKRSKEALSALERGRAEPTLDTLERIAAAYDLRLSELLAYLDDPDDTPRAALLRDITTLCAQLDDRALELVKAQVGAVVGWVGPAGTRLS